MIFVGLLLVGLKLGALMLPVLASIWFLELAGFSFGLYFRFTENCKVVISYPLSSKCFTRLLPSPTSR